MCCQKEKEIAFTQKKRKNCLRPQKPSRGTAPTLSFILPGLQLQTLCSIPSLHSYSSNGSAYLHVSLLTLVRPISPPDEKTALLVLQPEPPVVGKKHNYHLLLIHTARSKMSENES